jgi:ABC-type branched-subunit amino acid transport system ATPase component
VKLQISDLSMHFGGVVALNNLSMTLNKGDGVDWS